MTTTVEKVKTRGHWDIRVRPETHNANRIQQLADIERAVRDSVVSLRGWDFPHFDPRDCPTRSANYIEQATDWEHFVELWRAYKSGQFVSINALSEDWRDQSYGWRAPEGWQYGKTLSVDDAVFRLLEIYEFAARWSKALSIQESLVIECALRGIQNRSLQLNHGRAPFFYPRTAMSPEWSHSESYQVPALLAEARELAIHPTISLFEIFGWDVTPDTIREIQGKLRG